jgi:hypothetical protein
LADDGGVPAFPAKSSPNTVVQPAGAGGTGSATAAGAPTVTAAATPTRQPAIRVSADRALAVDTMPHLQRC